MTAVNVTDRAVADLPPALKTALASVQLPEVQSMLKKLADYNLGICMPHMHCEQTGAFQVLPDGILQVEAGLEVTFETRESLRERLDTMVPVAWAWRDGLSAMSMCYSYCERETEDDGSPGMHKIKHRRED
ncbi:hypothetical protein [Sphingomonas sp. SUN039]|uniref:hypothetical protein n=1 Tax=Sphingomonas sp. SUN039 TaxID=2937787 RepID=UPI002164A2D9|nr:hypothetical protein [Sphingomonas sp. SUN039]UVO53567.1 hypothetical protein M0209_05325 [Sphingomonas sp. SUN039]